MGILKQGVDIFPMNSPASADLRVFTVSSMTELIESRQSLFFGSKAERFSLNPP